MVTRIKSDRIIIPTGFFDGYVYFEGDKILAVCAQEKPYDCAYDYTGKIVSPGFIDIHVHGGDGCDFSGEDAEKVAKAVNFHMRHGTTTILPTVTSVSYDTTRKALEQIRLCKEKKLTKCNILGAHLEGPYFSPKQCGAQNPDALLAPDPAQYESLLDDFGEVILRWSYAPERDPDQSFVRSIVARGVKPSIGHSDAIYDECMAAYENGCKMVTHLYSCTSTITRQGGFRRLGVIETAYLLDDMDVEIIADGKHLPPELIRLICKQKGYDHICMVTDAIAAAGMESMGDGCLSGVNFIIEDGVAKLVDRSAFCGSIATTDRLVRVAVKEAGVPLLSAVKMMTENPARILGIHAGVLEEGARADVVVFDDDIQVQAVFAGGEFIQ